MIDSDEKIARLLADLMALDLPNRTDVQMSAPRQQGVPVASEDRSQSKASG